MKVTDIIANVEHLKEGWSDAKDREAWQETFASRSHSKSTPEPTSPVKSDLNKLQNEGLGAKTQTLPTPQMIGGSNAPSGSSGSPSSSGSLDPTTRTHRTR